MLRPINFQAQPHPPHRAASVFFFSDNFGILNHVRGWINFFYLPAAMVDNLANGVEDMPVYGGHNLKCRTVGVYYACVVKRHDNCVLVVQSMSTTEGCLLRRIPL